MKHRLIKSVAVTGAAGLICLAASPGYAATIVSQASATALILEVAGSGADTGEVSATNDGTGETKTGSTLPSIELLDPQPLLNLGVLAQDATATISGQDGISAACSGIAGEGGSLVVIGESGCLNPGEPIGISIPGLNLTGVETIPTGSVLDALNVLLDPIEDAVLGPVTAAITDALAPLGDLGISGNLGVVQSVCHAAPGVATGSANIADATIDLNVPGMEPLNLVTLPVNPAPNTKVITDLDEVINAILAGIEADLNVSLGGALNPILDLGLLDTIKQQLITGVLGPVADALAPLEDLLDITLNEQPAHPADSIQVTALHLELLPVAAEALGAPLLNLEIAKVSCGPNGRVGTPRPPTPPLPEIPTVVDSGSAGDSNDSGAALAGGLLVIAGAAAAMGYRRRQSL